MAEIPSVEMIAKFSRRAFVAMAGAVPIAQKHARTSRHRENRFFEASTVR